MVFNFKKAFEEKLSANKTGYTACGVINLDGLIYPLGSDTKVLSTIFELFTRPIIISIAEEHGFEMVEPSVQNHYPDFTFMKNKTDKKKIAIDVKTTYVNSSTDTFGYTLGGYTSFIRPGNESKNIVFPFNEYSEHWVIGYVYERVAKKKAGAHSTFTIDELKDMPLPYKDVRVFVQEKWRISSDRAGSGNTTNIGSITADLNKFEKGAGPFFSEDEFLDYWRNYERTDSERKNKFKNIHEYREWIKRR